MESKIKIQYISVNKLKHLPNNPRLIKDGRFEKLCKSIETLPNYFEARPLLVNNASGELVVYAGNMRLKAAKHLKLKEVPCIIETLSEQEQRERTLRDNIELGEWDFDILANEFSDFDLIDLGIELPELDVDIPDEPENLIGTKDIKDSTITITFESQSDLDRCLNEIKPFAEKYNGNIKLNSGSLNFRYI